MMEKLKLSVWSYIFNEERRYVFLFSSLFFLLLFTETVVCKDENVSSGERRVSFTRTGSRTEFKLSDMSQRHIVHFSEEMKLKAITLKAGYCHLKGKAPAPLRPGPECRLCKHRHGVCVSSVNFTMSRYNPTSCSDNSGMTVLLSITKNLHLSCTKTDKEVVLNLEVRPASTQI